VTGMGGFVLGLLFCTLFYGASSFILHIKKISFNLKEVAYTASSSLTSCWFEIQHDLASDSLCSSLSRFSEDGTLSNRWVLLNLEKDKNNYLVSLAFLPYNSSFFPSSNSIDSPITEKELALKFIKWLTFRSNPQSFPKKFPLIHNLWNILNSLKQSSANSQLVTWKSVENITCEPVSLSVTSQNGIYEFQPSFPVNDLLKESYSCDEILTKKKIHYGWSFNINGSTYVNSTFTFPSSQASTTDVVAAIVLFIIAVLALIIVLMCVVYCCPRAKNQFTSTNGGRSDVEMGPQGTYN